MSIKKKSILGLILLLFGVLVISNNGVRYNFYVLFLNYSIIVLSVLQIISKSSKPFSLHNITNLFFLFFIGLAPALQYKNHVFFMDEKYELLTSNFIFGNIVFLVIFITYLGLYHYFINKSKSPNHYMKSSFKLYSREFNNRQILVMSILAVIALFTFFNIEAIFYRKVLWLKLEDYSTPIASIFNVVRGVPLISLLYFKLNGRKNRAIEAILLLLIIICNFPLGISRYRVAITYLPICIMYIKLMFKRHYFTAIFSVGFLIVFPYLHHFRYSKDLLVNPFNFNMFNELHFDSYQNSVSVIANNIITNGQQLLGTVFFYIPRSIWESKPLGSSYMLAKTLDYNGFSNLAIGFFAEGYINFGYIGILIFTIVLAKVNAYCDVRFWFKEKNTGYFTISYLLLIPFEFFILRGSLTSSIANLSGYLFFVFIFYFVLKKIKFIKANVCNFNEWLEKK